MSTWVTHLIIADRVLERLPFLCRHEFCVGNIAPDCNIENEDWTSFTPSREVTHWMSGNSKKAADCERFLHEYIEQRTGLTIQEESFLLGYYAHLITDAEFMRFLRDEGRVRAAWDRIRRHSELRKMAVDMEETWDSLKVLIPRKEWEKDIYSLEKDYLDTHPGSGYFTEIIGLKDFPDYIDYLPRGAIARKARVMAGMPQREVSKYPYICISKEEYAVFLDRAAEMVTDAICVYKG